jgi:tetratricopeptide (TPR) repeat protein
MRILKPIILAMALFFGAQAGSAQKVDLSVPPPPPPEEPAPPAAPVFDPLHAAKSIEVGTFYMNQGKYDAAIDRFQEAAAYQPSLARPWELLGETYEKKHDPAKAIESYKKYLQIYPSAPDAGKVKQRIAALNQKVGAKPAK